MTDLQREINKIPESPVKINADKEAVLKLICEQKSLKEEYNFINNEKFNFNIHYSYFLYYNLMIYFYQYMDYLNIILHLIYNNYLIYCNLLNLSVCRHFIELGKEWG